ncbi:MAG: prepilin-type N-terminal cleavage/methylation domain-containing protein [Syntrophorhabdaceae bacterium]|nr:prepilin-type N-terminal cleavage/methylation domain-containing protein [Syntrophorhabdaceae bacterium]
MKRVGGSSERLLNFLRMSPRLGWREKGFTMIELIMVIAALSILAVSVGINFSQSGMKTEVAADQLIADIQYVQLLSIGLGSPKSISFRVDASDYGKYDVQNERKRLSGDEAVTGTEFGNTLTFNTLGEPSGSGRIWLSGGRSITVYAITGKVE